MRGKGIKKSATTGISSIMLCAIVMMSFLMATMITIYTSSIQQTKLIQRQQAYGSWQISVSDLFNSEKEVLESHGMVEKMGSMYVYGCLDVYGNIGYADEIAIDIGNLNLLEGRFPDTASEIALEEKTLYEMNLPLELGQLIPITIFYGSENQYKTESTLTLCGILKDYSSNWLYEEYEPITAFTAESFGNGGTYGSKEISLIKLKDEYSMRAEDLFTIFEANRSPILNEYTYEYYSQKNNAYDLWITLKNITILICCAILFIILYVDIRMRRESMLIVRMLGGTKFQMTKMYLSSRCRFMIGGAISGTILGLILTSFIIDGCNRFTGTELVLFVEYRILLKTLVQLLAGIAITLTLMILFYAVTPVSPFVNNMMGKQIRKVPPRKFRYYKLFQTSIKSSLALFLAVSLLSGFMLISVKEVYQTYQEYKYFLAQYPADYIYGMTGFYPYMFEDSEEFLNKLNGTYGIERAEGLAFSDYYEVTWSGEYDSNCAQKIFTFMQNLGCDMYENGLCSSFAGVTKGLYQEYLEMAGEEADISLTDSNMPKTNKFDYEAILYLPLLYEDENHLVFGDEIPVSRKKTAAKIQDSLIQAGDTVTVNVEDHIIELKLKAVLRPEQTIPFAYELCRPYTLIITEDLYKEIFGDIQYRYGLAYAGVKELDYQMDVALSKIESPLEVTSLRIERQEKRARLYESIVMTVIVLIFGIILTIFTCVGIMHEELRQMERRFYTLHLLGMSDKEMKSGIRKRLLQFIFSGCFMGFAILFLYQTLY